jgi:hypothetical protein
LREAELRTIRWPAITRKPRLTRPCDRHDDAVWTDTANAIVEFGDDEPSVRHPRYARDTSDPSSKSQATVATEVVAAAPRDRRDHATSVNPAHASSVRDQHPITVRDDHARVREIRVSGWSSITGEPTMAITDCRQKLARGRDTPDSTVDRRDEKSTGRETHHRARITQRRCRRRHACHGSLRRPRFPAGYWHYHDRWRRQGPRGARDNGRGQQGDAYDRHLPAHSASTPTSAWRPVVAPGHQTPALVNACQLTASTPSDNPAGQRTSRPLKTASSMPNRICPVAADQNDAEPQRQMDHETHRTDRSLSSPSIPTGEIALGMSAHPRSNSA